MSFYTFVKSSTCYSSFEKQKTILSPQSHPPHHYYYDHEMLKHSYLLFYFNLLLLFNVIGTQKVRAQ